MEDTKKVPLSQDAFDRLKAELEYLEGEGRQKIIDDIARARAHGDLSENAEYHAAREEQGRQEARVRELQHMLENAEIMEAGDDDGVVKPGKLITLRYDDGDEDTYLFATRAEKGSEYEVLTPDSPIGKAVEGRAVGDNVTATVPAGDMKLQVVDVRSP